MGAWTTEGGSGGIGTWRGGGLGRAVAFRAPVGRVEGTAIGADVLVGRLGSYTVSAPVSAMSICVESLVDSTYSPLRDEGSPRRPWSRRC